MLDKLKNLVGTVAPALGSALGSPLGGAAISMIADKLGVPNNQQAVEKAIRQATPDEMLKLKEADNEFEVKMKELDVDVYRLEVEDIQDARKNFSNDWTSKLLGFITLGGFMGYIFLVTLQPPEQNSEALINLVLGYLGGLASAVISFYFGASNSKDK
jgi:hypothetical protein